MRLFEVVVYATLVVSMIVLLALTVHLPAHPRTARLTKKTRLMWGLV